MSIVDGGSAVSIDGGHGGRIKRSTDVRLKLKLLLGRGRIAQNPSLDQLRCM